MQVTVVEAQDRVGGRVLTENMSSDQAIDVGAWSFSNAVTDADPDPLGVLVG